MDGVTILNTVYKTNIPCWIILILLFATLVSAAIAMYLMNADNVVGFLISEALTLALLVTTAVCGIVLHDTDEVAKYEVTISNEVNLKEFNEKYEILNQRGEIYTVRERGASE